MRGYRHPKGTGRAIRCARAWWGWSAPDLAAAAGVHPATVRAAEAERPLGRGVLGRIGKALNVPAGLLCEGALCTVTHLEALEAGGSTPAGAPGPAPRKRGAPGPGASRKRGASSQRDHGADGLEDRAGANSRAAGVGRDRATAKRASAPAEISAEHLPGQEALPWR